MRGSAALLATISLACQQAPAQESFAFSWVVEDVAGLGPANGNGVVEPGEDALISLYVSLQPGIGGPAIWNTQGGSGQPGLVGGVQIVYFDLLGTSALDTGTWIGPLMRAPGFALTPVGHIDPETNDLVKMIFGQYPSSLAPANPRNNDWFFRARWRPDGYAQRHVGFVFRNVSEIGGPTALLDVGLRDPENNILWVIDDWGHTHSPGGFLVVPSPSLGAWWLVGSLLWSRRPSRKDVISR